MEKEAKVLVYGQPEMADKVSRVLQRGTVTISDGRKEFANSLINSENIQCIFMKLNLEKVEDRNFLISIKRHFPLIPVAVIGEPHLEMFPYEIPVIDSNLSESAIIDEIRLVLQSEPPQNRRAYHRFSWILRGYLSFNGQDWKEYEINSLSAGGAFLRSEEAAPEPGTEAKIKIEFSNFRMLSTCEILPARQASSNVGNGFPVRFMDLKPNSRMIIDEIVHDALYSVLTEPEAEAEMPRIDDPDILTPDFEMT
jgi:hypothetical protein